MEKEISRTGVIVIDTKKYPEHKKMSGKIKEMVQSGELLEGVTEMQVVDMAQAGPLYEKYFQICSYTPTFVITLDLAGFELRTEGDGYSYNTIPCRMAHFLFEAAEMYREILAGEFNFSMFFYAYPQSSKMIQKEYPELLNVCELSEGEKSLGNKGILDEQELKAALQDFFTRGKIK